MLLHTQIDSELQRLAAISNQLISSLTSLLRCAAPLPRQGAFRCFASLGANDEDIRKRIIEMDGLMEEVLAGLGDPCPEVSSNYFRILYDAHIGRRTGTFISCSMSTLVVAIGAAIADDISSKFSLKK